jgi:hypothetical protein
LIEENTRTALLSRLRKAGTFIHNNFTTLYGNINYAAAGAYGLSLLGRLLEEPSFTRKGRELAHQTLAFFTKNDGILFGEGHPTDLRSMKGCVPVDLGYNVTESLPSLIHYSLLENDREVQIAVISSFKSHLEFMLPDGGWDNSWGTRSYKWTYWGSRTTDGCQSAFMHLAAKDPVFATAAWRNMQLLRFCTHDGLLHGGPHFAHHAVPACIHHTFVQAKAIAGALYQANLPERLDSLPSLPRALASGVRHFPDMDVHLAAFGPWRATLSGYDWFYRPGLYQATGGVIGMLWHDRLGPLLTAGLATYLPVEAGNMQPVPDGVDFPLACRIEIRTPDGKWFTNLHDGGAFIRHESNKESLRMIVECRLLSARAKEPDSGPCRFRIEHEFHRDSFTITATPLNSIPTEWALVVPVISTQDERIIEHAESSWEVIKSQGRLTISSNSPITRVPCKKERAFNLIPGFQAIPFRFSSSGLAPIEINLTSRT